jgi:hypothetical protein
MDPSTRSHRQYLLSFELEMVAAVCFGFCFGCRFMETDTLPQNGDFVRGASFS